MAETIARTTAEIFGLYFPIVGAINIIAKEIYQICDDAECNQKICSIMAGRVRAAENAMESIMKSIGQNEDKFRQRDYYLAFKRFENIMINVKEYTEKVSKLKGYKVYLNAREVKNKYEKLTQEYDMCMKDLHFAIAVANKAARDEDSRKVDKSLKDIENTLNSKLDHKLDQIAKSVDFMKSQMNNQSTNFHVYKIKSSELNDPVYPKDDDVRGHIFKKIYNLKEVACKPIKEFSQFEHELAVLVKLSQTDNIHRFYGLSNVDNMEVMVFEWAQHRTLKELYNTYDIPWARKIQIVRDIFRGLSFLRRVDIFHHDVRCENVFMLHSLEAKLGNFKCAREVSKETRDLKDIAPDIIRWMAPEQIEKYYVRSAKKGYTFQCEMFSFGMLIWELCYEKLPYLNRDINSISKHVLEGKRENLLRGKFDNPKDADIQLEFIKIIGDAWHHIPSRRMKIDILTIKLEELAGNYPIPLGDPPLLKDKTLKFEGGDDSPDLLIPLEKGIQYHKKHDYKKAWQCFDENAKLGNKEAKYWKAYYLSGGYGVVEVDQMQAMELFDEAAEIDYSDARCRYAVLLLSNLRKDDDEATKKHNIDKILHYFTLSANHGNYEAMFYLGDIYVKGKLRVTKNKELGLVYLRLAAHNKNSMQNDAVKSLKELGEKI
ncbi:9154_t:CDS:2 [Gigaspora margarita]|uniref:9154_t:CDS:1 n=1 Tax=Gigaspora margarita TaxID=4874 RepID=A0ABN7UP52_GIGMA|nr:9154_t:CDS:2 [Gigaspora margarita]